MPPLEDMGFIKFGGEAWNFMDRELIDAVVERTGAALRDRGLGEGACRRWKSPRPWSEELLARAWLWS